MSICQQINCNTATRPASVSTCLVSMFLLSCFPMLVLFVYPFYVRNPMGIFHFSISVCCYWFNVSLVVSNGSSNASLEQLHLGFTASKPKSLYSEPVQLEGKIYKALPRQLCTPFYFNFKGSYLVHLDERWKGHTVFGVFITRLDHVARRLFQI